MNRRHIPRFSRTALLGLLFAFTWGAATGSESAPRFTLLTPSEADSQFSQPFTGFGAAVGIRGSTAWVGIAGYFDSESPTESGRVGIFTQDKSTGEWIRSGTLDATDQQDGERNFGSSIVLRRHDAAVGSFGAVRIYSRTARGWHVLAKITSDAPNSVMGPVLAYDGKHLAVQVTVTETQLRYTLVYVYEIDRHGAARLMTKLSALPSDTGSFGSSLALEHSTLLIGSPGGKAMGEHLPPGVVYVYCLHNGAWELTQSLSGSEAAENSDFGAAVAIRGRVILVGAPNDDLVIENYFTSAAGAVYVFRRQHDGPWVQTQRVRPTRDEVGAFSGFGWSLAMGVKRVAIGAPTPVDPDQTDLGQTDIYDWHNGTLAFEQQVVPPQSVSAGFSLSIWQDELIIGVDADGYGIPINLAWIVGFASQTK